MIDTKEIESKDTKLIVESLNKQEEEIKMLKEQINILIAKIA